MLKNPRHGALLQRAWRMGALGHKLGSLVIDEKHVRLLERWVDNHGGIVVRTANPEDGDFVVGIHACFCPECEIKAVEFVMQARCSLLARAAGDSSYTFQPHNPGVVLIEERAVGELDEARAKMFAEHASKVASDIAFQVAGKVAANICSQIGGELRKEIRALAANVARKAIHDFNQSRVGRQLASANYNARIAAAFAEQDRMMADTSPRED